MPENLNTIVIIRPMRGSDVDACASLMLAIPLWAQYGMTPERARAAFTAVGDGTSSGIVAEEDGRAIGFVVFRVTGTFVHSGYIHDVGVVPEAQNRGVGSLLMEAAEAEIFRHGPNVFLMVSAFNTGAHRFYERRGYQRVGDIPEYIRRGITEVLYRKSLGPILPGEP
jgi:ribosomal protein S18 acetylase RimI-like enzyme